MWAKLLITPGSSLLCIAQDLQVACPSSGYTLKTLIEKEPQNRQKCKVFLKTNQTSDNRQNFELHSSSGCFFLKK